jgi:hypothetical protein
MGNFYTNYTLRGPDQQAVATVLAGRSAIVTPSQDGCVVVFDEESDGQHDEVISELASRLSGRFNCPLLAVLNHDDDILWYQLYLSGELVDEYNSVPGYFETEDEDVAMAGPAGGDARKLCAAFGVTAGVPAVENILREGSAATGGDYTFEVERHNDLVAALGISSFGVGASFRAISSGELPEELSAGDLIKTQDLAVTESPEAGAPKPVPGYHKVSFRAHPQLTRSIPTGWMPNRWAELACPEQDLSGTFHKTVAAHREIFKQLGFVEQGFKKNTRILNPNSRESGGINFLDASRCYFGQIIYNRSFLPGNQAEKETVVISFTAVFPNEVFSCTNHVDFLPPIPHHNIVRLKSNEAGFIHGQFIDHLKQRTDTPRHFTDLSSLQAWFDSNATEIFEYRVRTGTWVRMSDYEVERARRKLK